MAEDAGAVSGPLVHLLRSWFPSSVDSLPNAAALRQGTTVRFEGIAGDDDPEDFGALDIAARLVLSR